MSLHIMSQWQQKPVPAQPVTDEERHQVFSTFAVKQAQAEMPWLLPMLDELNATIYVSPRLFLFATPSNPGQWTEITQLSERIAMVPWAEAHETQQ